MKPKEYAPEHLKYLKSIYKGRHILEITKLFNKRFHLKKTAIAVKSFAKKNGLKSGYKNKTSWNIKYNEKHIRYLKEITPNTDYKTVTELFNKKFGFGITVQKLRSLCKRKGVRNGFTGFFPKGHVPANKGMKGVYAPGCEKTWFKKGNVPWDYMPVGSERVTADGYVEIKISDTALPVQRRWKAKHIIVWEKARGAIPRKHNVIFLDGNRKNITLDNLMLVSAGVHAVMNRNKYYTNDKEETKKNLTFALLKVALANKKRESFKKIKGNMVVLNNNGKRIWISRVKDKWIAVMETKKGQRVLAKLKPRDRREDAERDLCEYALLRGWQRVEK